MTLVLGVILGTLAAATAGLLSLFFILPSWSPLWVVVLAGLGYSVVHEYRDVEATLLDVAEARMVTEHDEPELHRLVERVAGMLDMAPPRIALADAEIPSGFVVGTRRRRAIIAISGEMRRKLDAEELEAVLAHELAHLANRDAVVMTIASLPRTIGLELFAGEQIWLWYFLWPFGLVLYGWGALLTRIISRYREFAADAGSALATGRPETLMSALEKLAEEAERIPESDLRQIDALNPFFIVSSRRRRVFVLLDDHPPLQKRLAALAKIARGMGRPVS
jgi:heat shock protein HtpX